MFRQATMYLQSPTETVGGLFSPDKTCSRAEIVTFLYRAFAE